MLDKLYLLGKQKQVITAMSDVGFYMNDLNIQPKLLLKLLNYRTHRNNAKIVSHFANLFMANFFTLQLPYLLCTGGWKYVRYGVNGIRSWINPRMFCRLWWGNQWQWGWNHRPEWRQRPPSSCPRVLADPAGQGRLCGHVLSLKVSHNSSVLFDWKNLHFKIFKINKLISNIYWINKFLK